MPPSYAQAALLKVQQAAGNGNGLSPAGAASNGEDGAASHKAKSHYLHAVKLLLTNPSYILLLLSYGMNVGTFYAVSTLLNQIILNQFPLDQFPVSL